MPKITVKVPHQQNPDELAAKIKPALEKTVNDFQGHDLVMDWTGNAADFRFQSLAFSITGRLAIEPTDVVVEIDLPFAAMMFKDQVQKAITKNVTRALEQK